MTRAFPSLSQAFFAGSLSGLLFLQACNQPTSEKTVYISSGTAGTGTANVGATAAPAASGNAPSTGGTDSPSSSPAPAPASAPISTPKPSTPAPATPAPAAKPTTAPSPAPAAAPTPATGTALVECTTQPTLGRLSRWLAGEGELVPVGGSTLLVKEGNANVAKVEFKGNDWHVVSALLTNMSFDTAQVDLSIAKSFTINYSATADFYVQLRPSFKWDGGDKYLVKLPATAGAVKSLTVPLVAASFTTLPNLGAPTYPFEMALKQARGFVFVGQPANVIKITGLKFDGYVPACP